MLWAWYGWFGGDCVVLVALVVSFDLPGLVCVSVVWVGFGFVLLFVGLMVPGCLVSCLLNEVGLITFC